MKESTGQLGKAIVLLVLVWLTATVVARFFVPIVAVLVLVIVLRIVWYRTGW